MAHKTKWEIKAKETLDPMYADNVGDRYREINLWIKSKISTNDPVAKENHTANLQWSTSDTGDWTL